MKLATENQANELNKSIARDRAGQVGTTNNVIYIRGLGFKCRSGSRREQVLLTLEKNDQGSSDGRWWISLVLALVAGFGFGVAASWSGLI